MLRHPYTPNYHLIRTVDLEDERAWKYVKILDLQFYTQSICTHDTHTHTNHMYMKSINKVHFSIRENIRRNSHLLTQDIRTTILPLKS
jgi:hypothetical protein